MEFYYFKKARLKKQTQYYYRNLSEDRKEEKKDNIQGIDTKISLMRKSKKESNIWKIVIKQARIIVKWLITGFGLVRSITAFKRRESIRLYDFWKLEKKNSIILLQNITTFMSIMQFECWSYWLILILYHLMFFLFLELLVLLAFKFVKTSSTISSRSNCSNTSTFFTTMVTHIATSLFHSKAKNIEQWNTTIW